MPDDFCRRHPPVTRQFYPLQVICVLQIFEDSLKMAVCAAAHPHSQCISSPSQLEVRSCRTHKHVANMCYTVCLLVLCMMQDVLPSTRTRRSLFRPTNPVTKYLHPHLSTGKLYHNVWSSIRSEKLNTHKCVARHAQLVLSRHAGNRSYKYSQPNHVCHAHISQVTTCFTVVI